VKNAEVRLVLDTSAVLAYARGSIHVGETIAVAADDGGLFGVSPVCLAEAHRLVEDDRADGVPLLVNHPACVVLALPAEDWSALATWTKEFGRVDLAAAFLEATDRDGFVLTGEPGSYGDKGDGALPVIAI
jgi:hypothetical protein